MAERLRQAIVVIHGMGEQRPADTLNSFSEAIIPDGAKFYSRADKVTKSFESRRRLLPASDDGPITVQTEIYEYHWAHLMQGNRLDDMWATFRRILFPAPNVATAVVSVISLAVAIAGWVMRHGAEAGEAACWFGVALSVAGIVVFVLTLGRYVPSGLIVVWVVVWAVLLWAAWAVAYGPLSDVGPDGGVVELVTALLGAGVASWIATYVISHVLPSWITSSFVDVVRYLDTSPRSYDVRHDIREGIVDLLEGLHDSGRYQRVMIVAHSLGSYIAYDAITHLWSRTNELHAGPVKKHLDTGPKDGEDILGLDDLETAADTLEEAYSSGGQEYADANEQYRVAQRKLWIGLRRQGNPWLITDLVTFGSPMYFADRLYTRNAKKFKERVDLREIPTSPPQPELKNDNNIHDNKLFFSWNNKGRRVLHEGAPFAVVRWTNLWYPARFGFFGDWFGERLAPLYGAGVHDIALTRNLPWRWLPGYAHALYVKCKKDRIGGAFAGELAKVIGLDEQWLQSVQATPTDPDTG